MYFLLDLLQHLTELHVRFPPLPLYMDLSFSQWLSHQPHPTQTITTAAGTIYLFLLVELALLISTEI